MLRTSYKLLCAALVTFLVLTSTPAWALDWHDSEWSGLGCASKLSGDWVPITDSTYTGSKIEFKANGATLSSKENSSVLYAFTQNAKDGYYLNLKRVSEGSTSFPKYLKIRPHLAVKNISEGRKVTLCKIKVFLFESKQKANQMSYLSWDIYKREQ